MCFFTLEVKVNVNEMCRDVQDTSSAVRGVWFEQEREKTERWLSSPDSSTKYNRALEQRQEGTGLWFLQGHVYDQCKT